MVLLAVCLVNRCIYTVNGIFQSLATVQTVFERYFFLCSRVFFLMFKFCAKMKVLSIASKEANEKIIRGFLRLFVGFHSLWILSINKFKHNCYHSPTFLSWLSRGVLASLSVLLCWMEFSVRKTSGCLLYGNKNSSHQQSIHTEHRKGRTNISA